MIVCYGPSVSVRPCVCATICRRFIEPAHLICQNKRLLSYLFAEFVYMIHEFVELNRWLLSSRKQAAAKYCPEEMANILTERLSFMAEWYQNEASLMRQFLLNFFPYDGSIELFDCNTNKTFLKRVRVPGITEDNLYIGAKVNVFGRQITVKDFKDDYTRSKVSDSRQLAFCLIPPTQQQRLADVIKCLCDNNFYLDDCAMYELSSEQCHELGETIPRLTECAESSGSLPSGPCTSLLISGTNAINRLKQLCSEHTLTDTNDVNSNFILSQCILYTDSSGDVNAAKEFFFSKQDRFKLARSPDNGTTLCLIKPHAVLQRQSGQILDAIMHAGFVVTALKMSDLNKRSCEDFYQVYNGIVPSYPQMVSELSSGPFLAMEIANKHSTKHPWLAFRELCGPADPNVARQIRPDTLRARHGVNFIQNSVHCSDIEENCAIETDYFFNGK